jgi:hypothetical protein
VAHPDRSRSASYGRPAASAAHSARDTGIPMSTVGTVAFRAPMASGVTPWYWRPGPRPEKQRVPGAGKVSGLQHAAPELVSRVSGSAPGTCEDF